MKKITYIFIFVFVFLNSCSYAVLDWDKIQTSNSTNVAMKNPMNLAENNEFEEFKQKYTASIYETDSYKTKLINFTQIDEHTFSDNVHSDSGITLTVGAHQMPTSLIAYEDIYNVSYLKELEETTTKELENSLDFECKPSVSRIDDFSYYPAFFFKYKLDITDDFSYYMWIFEIFSDNYVYCVFINSPQPDYISTSNVRTFIDSFNIKDTTNLCTPSAIDTVNISNDTSTAEETTNNNFIAIFIADIIFAAVVFLFIPIIIRFVFKDSFKSGTAFWISLINFLFIKIILSILLNIPFSTTTAWWYLFIGQAILTRPTSKALDNNEDLYETNDEAIKKF